MENFDCFLKKPIAHRGLHDNINVENSISAFVSAIKGGYPIETDVHILRDGTVAIHHDSNLKRMCGADVHIETLTRETLKKFKLKNGESIPTFRDLLSVVNGKVPILIELKTENGKFTRRLAKAVLRDLEKYDYKNTIALQSFDPFAIRYVRKNSDKYMYGQLATLGGEDKSNNLIYKWLGRLRCCRISKPQFIAYDINNMPNEYIQKYFDDKIPVLAWTVDSKEKLEIAKQHANNIIFENIIPD